MSNYKTWLPTYFNVTRRTSILILGVKKIGEPVRSEVISFKWSVPVYLKNALPLLENLLILTTFYGMNISIFNQFLIIFWSKTNTEICLSTYTYPITRNLTKAIP